MARKRSSRRNRDSSVTTIATPTTHHGVQGGQYAPLSQTQLTQVDHAIREVLTEIGFSEAPPIVVETVLAAGGTLTAAGRLCFAATTVDQFLTHAQRDFTLYGQTPGVELHLSGKTVYAGSGGAAPQVVDLDTGEYRDSTLNDLYAAARLVDKLDHLHFFSRSLVARDMPDPLSLDINTAYASLKGTRKHVCTSISDPAHVSPIAEMCFAIAGSQAAFVEKPFLSLNINHSVPPLRLHQESCEVMAEAVKLGIPVHCNTFGQLGASGPVTLIGSVVQNIAESLAGMLFAWLIDPAAKAILGARPMITDLRTGAMSGGSGEQALAMAATTQVAQYYNLPNTCIAGATDSKIPDAQSGYEKALTVTLAAQAGCNMITQACGMQAGLMAVAFESYVIDNDMIGSIMRSLGPLEVSDASLAVQSMRDVVNGEGHFLGHADTYARMQTDFLYPEIADRQSPAEWEAAGGKDMRERAIARTKEILATHWPEHVSTDTDIKLQALFNLQLNGRDRS